MRIVVLVALLAAMVVCTLSCTVKGSIQAGNVAPTDETKGPTAGKEAQAGVKPAATEPSVEALRVGDKYDASSLQVPKEVSEFAPSAPEIHMSANLSGLTKDAKIKATLIAVSVMDQKGQLIQNYEVASDEIAAPGDQANIHFKFSAPGKGWPTGEYVIELSVDGKKITEAEFMVKGKG